jgi:S1-C subfamily serine protease
MKAVSATVRIVNRRQRSEASGVLVGRKEGAVYVLTAAHVVRDADRIRLSTYAERCYPNPLKTYEGIEVVAQTRDVRDLALLRIATTDPIPALMTLCPSSQLPDADDQEVMSVVPEGLLFACSKKLSV